MPHFLYDALTLAYPKADLYPIGNADPAKHIQGDDWNDLAQAVVDVQSDAREWRNRTVSGNTTLAASDYAVYCNATGITITLPAGAVGYRFLIKDITGNSSPSITIACSGGQQIDGSATISLSGAYDAVGIRWDPTAGRYRVIARVQAAGGGGASSLQATYTASGGSAPADVVLDATRQRIRLKDNSPSVGNDVLEIASNDGNTTYWAAGVAGSYARLRYGVEQTATYTSGTLALNPANGETLVVTLGANVAAVTIANGKAGQTCRLVIKQDGTGGRTMPTPPSNLKLHGGVFGTSTSANARDAYDLVWDNGNTCWQEVGRVIGDGHIVLPATSTPSTPASGKLALYARTINGFPRLAVVDHNGLIATLTRDGLITVQNNTGSTLTKGTVVYFSGTDGSGTQRITAAKADATATMPGVGLVRADITTGSYGEVQLVGVLTGLNTSGFSANALLYVSASSAGALTATPPAHPNVRQAIGYVGTSDATNGSIVILPRTSIGDSNGTIQNSYSVGDGTAGAKVLNFVNAYTSALSANATAARTWTLPDLDGTFALTTGTQDITGKGRIDLQTITTNGSTPTIAAAGVGVGTSPTLTITGTDTAGYVSITPGSSPSSSAGQFIGVTFAVARAAAPRSVILWPANAAAAALSGINTVHSAPSTYATTGWGMSKSTGALTQGTAYMWNYLVVG